MDEEQDLGGICKGISARTASSLGKVRGIEVRLERNQDAIKSKQEEYVRLVTFSEFIVDHRKGIDELFNGVSNSIERLRIIDTKLSDYMIIKDRLILSHYKQDQASEIVAHKEDLAYPSFRKRLREFEREVRTQQIEEIMKTGKTQLPKARHESRKLADIPAPEAKLDDFFAD